MFDNKNVGTAKPVTADVSKAGLDAGNYTANATASASADITPIALVIGITANDKSYDGNAAAATSASITSGLVSGDVVTVSSSNGLFNNKNVGTAKPVTADVSKSGTDAGNYSLSSVATTTATISKKYVTALLIGNVSKMYNGTTVATISNVNYNLPGIVAMETVVLNNPATGVYDTKYVGILKMVSVSGLSISGADVANYELSSSTANANIGTITIPDAVSLTVTSTNVTCNGASNGTITITASTGATITVNGIAPPPTYGPGVYTVVATLPNGYENGVTSETRTITITQPNVLSAGFIRNNPNHYFGLSGDQTSLITVTPVGGVAPYKISISMSRPLISNYITSNGDESWVPGTVAAASTSLVSSTNISLPATGPNTAGAPSTTVTNIPLNGSYSIRVGLISNASFTATITDANECVLITQPIEIHGEDVRCFAGNSGKEKIKLCHRIGNAKNPCQELCVDESAVSAHLAHGDFLGQCTPGCVAPATITKPVVIGKQEIIDVAEFNAMAYPNPSNHQFTIAVQGSSDEKVEVFVYDMLARMIKKIEKPNAQNILFGEELPSGEYLLLIRQGSNQKAINVIKK